MISHILAKTNIFLCHFLKNISLNRGPGELTAAAEGRGRGPGPGLARPEPGPGPTWARAWPGPKSGLNRPSKTIKIDLNGSRWLRLG